MNSIFACLISAYLIYGDRVVCLFSVFAYLKYIFYTYCSASTDLLRIELSWYFRRLKNDCSQNNCLVFVVLYMYNFHLSLAARHCLSLGGKNIFSISSFWIGFTCVFHLYFLVLSLMLPVIVKEWKFCCIWFRLSSEVKN